MEIPNNLPEISLEHQEKLEAIWKPFCLKHNLQFCEFSFANVYLFRKEHSYQFIDGSHPCVRGKFDDGSYYLITALSPEEIAECWEKIPPNYCIYPIQENWAESLENLGRCISYERKNSDYLFSRKKLETLAGRNLSSRRNLIHQLESAHRVTAKPLLKDEISDAIEILEQWIKQGVLEKEKTDYYPVLESLKEMERLKLFGRIAYADNVPIGFTIGDMLTPTSALFQTCKSLRTHKGTTPYLYRDFAIHLPDSVEWINLEQDLGIESLRQAKNAYDPDYVLNKWRICD